MKIRDANMGDMEAITAIYNDAVLNTTAIWNDTTIDVANRVVWLAEKQRIGYPVLVAIDDDQVVLGYASFGDWRAFDGYRHTVEHSVYVNKEYRGAGIGKALMVKLITRARALGKHVLVAAIEAENETSIQLHKKLGFKQAGILTEVGTKFGRWLDLAFLQLSIDTDSDPNAKQMRTV